MESIPSLGFATISFFTNDIVKLPFFEFASLGIRYQTVGVRSGEEEEEEEEGKGRGGLLESRI